MTVNSLINFGVPGIGTRSPPLQPIMRNKFRIVFHKFGKPESDTYLVTQQVRLADLPYLDGKTGRSSSTIRIEVLDDITTGCLRHILAQYARQRDNKDDDTSFEMRIELLGGGTASDGPNVIRTYSFKYCSLTSLTLGEFSYADAEGLTFYVDVSHEHFEIYDADLVRLW